MSEIDPREAGSAVAPKDKAGSLARLEAGSAIEPAEAAGALELAEADETPEEAGSHELAIATDGGPVVAEIELLPLAIRPQLQPSSARTAAAEPAAGFWGRYRLFIVTVVLPMLVGALYLAVIAAPRFTSSASFIVRSTGSAMDPLASIGQGMLGNPQSAQLTSQQASPGAGQTMQQGASPSASGGTQIGSQQNTPSTTIAFDETYAVNAYLTSRDLVDELAKNDRLREILSRPEGDFLYRFPTFWLPDDNEFLYQRFQWMTKADVDSVTTLSTVEVNAFRPDDAQALLKAMLGYAEGLVNEMSRRAYEDGLAAANRFVAEAQKEVDAVSAELKAYRGATGSVDPNLVAQSKLKVIEGLSTQLAQIEATIAQQRAISPNSPNLASLRAQEKSFRAEIDKRKLEIAGTGTSEAAKLETYELLTIRRALAATVLQAAVAERDQARQDTERAHFYIQLITQPNLSRDYARYPRTVLDLLVLLALCLFVFQILRKFGEMREGHRP